jgi:hypothetical protein
MEFRVQFLIVSWFCIKGHAPIYHPLLNSMYSKHMSMTGDEVQCVATLPGVYALIDLLQQLRKRVLHVGK